MSRFLFAVVSKHPPHVVTVCEIDPADLEDAASQNRAAVDLWARCLATDVWPDHGPAVSADEAMGIRPTFDPTAGPDVDLGDIATTVAQVGGITAGAQMDFGTAMIPEGPVGFGCPTGGSGMSVLAGASDEQVQAAMDYITFCTNTENATYWAMNTGYMPVRNSARESEEFQAFLEENPNNRTAIEQLPMTQMQDPIRPWVPNGDVIIGNGWEQILVNNRPAQEVFSEVAAELDQEKQPVLEALEAIEG